MTFPDDMQKAFKVYTDPEKAESIFFEYDRLEIIFRDWNFDGTSSKPDQAFLKLRGWIGDKPIGWMLLTRADAEMLVKKISEYPPSPS